LTYRIAYSSNCDKWYFKLSAPTSRNPVGFWWLWFQLRRRSSIWKNTQHGCTGDLARSEVYYSKS